MAGGMDLGNSGKGGKKPLDTPINLVPFIDLMAVTISFLIMTAVWNQIGRLQVSQGGDSGEATEQQDKTVPVTLLVSDTEFKLTAGPTEYGTIAITRDAKQRLEVVKLQEKLKEVRGALPDQNAITVQATDLVKYEDLVRIIDECIGAGLPNVSVAAAAT